MECHDRVRSLREENRLTQKTICTLLQIKESTYRGYETGRRQFPLYHLLTLGQFFDSSLDYLSGASAVRKPYPEL